MTLKTPHGDFQNDWHFGFYKDMPLAKANNIEVEVKGDGGKVAGAMVGRVVPNAPRRLEGKPPYQITLSTDKPAFFVWANARGVRGEFDDNAFTLLPGRPRTLSFTSKDGEVSLDDFIKSLKASHLSGLEGCDFLR